MHNWPNRPTSETLEEIVERLHARRYEVEYVKRFALEVEVIGDSAKRGQRYTLDAIFSHAPAPQIGEAVECTGLGLGVTCRVLGVAVGYPGEMAVHRTPYDRLR